MYICLMENKKRQILSAIYIHKLVSVKKTCFDGL